ncbi:hypothetical protein ACFXAO_26415 [Streptomyces lavendulae]|uniref:hypothetical protein n=1 Tax=Streptomyces lavendulae TaxID=1914 RepID=UPI0036B5A93C
MEPRRIGTLRVPSGLLAVSGPDIDHEDGPRIAVPVLAGEYGLEEVQGRRRPAGVRRGQISGFATDGAIGCFADAGAWEALLALFERGLVQGDLDLDPDVYEDISDSM